MSMCLHKRGDEEIVFSNLPGDPLDLLFEPNSHEPPSPMPDNATFGLDYSKPWRDEDPRVVAYLEAERAYFHQATNARIPKFKFSSHDDWWVTPDEIRKTLDHIQAQGPDLPARLLEAFVGSLYWEPEELAEHFGNFVEFLQECVDEGFLIS